MCRRALTAVVVVALLGAGCAGQQESATSGPPDPAELSPAPSPRPPAPTGTPATVRIEPGDDLQAAVDAAPPGSTFTIAAGVHREQVVVPRDGDRFVGEPGAVLNGARVLPAGSFTRADEGWYIDGQPQEGLVRGKVRDGVPVAVRNPEEVFVDGERRLRAVDQLADLEPGAFYFDYDADRIWLADDPASFELIETSVAPFAFGGTGVRDVVIENLVVEKYASPVQFGAIGGSLGFQFPYDWTVRHVEARWNHGGGIGIGPGMVITNVDVHHNGQVGLIGDGQDESVDGQEGGYAAEVVVRDSRVHHNNTLGFDDKHEAGATKFKDARAGFVFENNWVHDNDGSGPWWDGDNAAATIRRNLIVDNRGSGVFYEISRGPTVIADNVILRNGRDADRLDPGVFVSNSSGVEVTGNTVAGGPFGVVVVSRGDRDPAASDVTVRDNQIAFAGGWTGVLLMRGADAGLLDHIEIGGNGYLLADPETGVFRWGEEELDWTGWRARVEPDARPLERDALLDAPDDRGFERAAYGPVDAR